MIDRINLLLKAKNISARQFAEEIGIQPSGMSHILSGRNNPSLDFVMKVVRRWPEVNINWLMFGKGEMFAGAPLNAAPVAPTPVATTPMPAAPSTPQQQREAEPDLFSQPEEIVEQPPVEVPQYVAPAVPQPQPQPQIQPQPQPVVAPIVEPQPQIQPSIQSQPQPKVQMQENRINEIAEAVVEPQPIVAKQKKMVKMIIVYDDHTFSEYYPE